MRIRRIAANDFKQLQSIDLFLPPVGRFLVQGKNEAGKSTLFEALYYGLFGKGLTGRNQEDLIGYGKEKARVEVWIDVRDSVFKIERTLSRTKTQTVHLTIEKPDRAPDTVRGANAVSKRLTEEFKFDGDALLNTCFVEQKKLDKLEGLDRDKRETSLMRLLNLDNLRVMEDDFKIVAEDRSKLEYATNKRDLARVRDGLPRREARLKDVEQELRLAAARASLAQALREQADSAAQYAEIERLMDRAAILASREEEARAVETAGRAIHEMLDKLREIDGLRQDLSRLANDLCDATLAHAALPDTTRRVQMLQRLSTRLTRLDRVYRAYETAHATALDRERVGRELQARLVERDNEASRVQELETAVAQAEQTLAEAETAVKAWHERVALLDWREVYLAATAPQRAQAELTQRQAERQAAHQALDTELATLVQSAPTSTQLLALVQGLVDRLRDLFRQLDQAAHRAGYLEGSYATLLDQAEADQKRLATAERRLREHGGVVPATVESAETRLAHLTALVGDHSRDQLQATANAARDRLAALRGQRDEVNRKLTDLNRQLRGQNVDEALRMAQVARAQAEKALGICDRWRPRADAALNALNLTPGSLERAFREAEYEARTLRDRAMTLTRLTRDQAERETRLTACETRIVELHGLIAPVEASLPQLTPTLRLSDVQPIHVALQERWKALGGKTLRQELDQTNANLASCREARRQAERRQAEHLQTAQARLREAGLISLLPDLGETTVKTAYDRLAEFALDQASLESERDSLYGEIRSLRDRRDDLERKLGLGDHPLDLAECETELAQLQYEHRVREKARRMVEGARKRIIDKIMPHTLNYMSTILPQLTSGRYMDAQLTEDYKIKVWDERAGDRGEYKQKDIFSGGCRDQLSLALRLSFALATLPAERGGAPSFIFLDEPLGAFDSERADALLHLLTRGEVGRAFDQIFLISHVPVDASAFTYRIRLDDGRIADHDLPSPNGDSLIASMT